MKTLEQQLALLRHDDLKAYLESDEIPSAWFPLFESKTSDEEEQRFFSALVPVDAIPKLLKSNNWDLAPRDGAPITWMGWKDGEQVEGYDSVGTEHGIEPLVIWRSFHGIRPSFIELCQEFRLFHNLFPDPSRRRYFKFDEDGNESEAVRYDEKLMEVKTDLLREFCAVKQMALGVYVESFRYSTFTLEELGLKPSSVDLTGERHVFPLTITREGPHFKRRKDFETRAQIPASDNQSEFDGQLLALTKVLIDSLNEKQLKREITLDDGDKGITKLEKFLVARGSVGFEPHIKLLRVLQDLRSKSAAHRKGYSYDELVAELGIPNEGQQKVLASILRDAVEFIRFLRKNLLHSEDEDGRAEVKNAD